jgi:hypothetical protein
MFHIHVSFSRLLRSALECFEVIVSISESFFGFFAGFALCGGFADFAPYDDFPEHSGISEPRDSRFRFVATLLAL